MDIKPIKTANDYKNSLSRIEKLWNSKVGTPGGDELDILSTLVAAYEDIHHPIEKPNPIEAIKFRMEQLGLRDQDLVPFIGARSKVSEVLNFKRRLSLPMIRRLSAGLNIPAENLIQTYRTSA